LGAVVFEMIGGRNWRAATKAGIGALLGLAVGTIGKLACAVAMMGLFAVNVILKSGAAPGAVREVVMRAVGGG
jgi:uncharacterized protein YqgC (DUF456 family)